MACFCKFHIFPASSACHIGSVHLTLLGCMLPFEGPLGRPETKWNLNKYTWNIRFMCGHPRGGLLSGRKVHFVRKWGKIYHCQTFIRQKRERQNHIRGVSSIRCLCMFTGPCLTSGWRSRYHITQVTRRHICKYITLFIFPSLVCLCGMCTCACIHAVLLCVCVCVGMGESLCPNLIAALIFPLELHSTKLRRKATVWAQTALSEVYGKLETECMDWLRATGMVVSGQATAAKIIMTNCLSKFNTL